MNNLELALQELDEEWLASLQIREDVPPFEVSKQFLKWEQRVIYGKKSTSSKVVKVLLVAAALLIILSVVALSTTKGREFMMHFFKDSAVFSLQAERMDKVNDLTVSYLPEGFELEDDYKKNTYFIKHYINQTQWFEIQKRSIKTTVDFDYLETAYEEIERNGITYKITYVDDNICNVIWNYHDFYYHVFGNIDRETALQIAFGVE